MLEGFDPMPLETLSAAALTFCNIRVESSILLSFTQIKIRALDCYLRRHKHTQFPSLFTLYFSIAERTPT